MALARLTRGRNHYRFVGPGRFENQEWFFYFGVVVMQRPLLNRKSLRLNLAHYHPEGPEPKASK